MKLLAFFSFKSLFESMDTTKQRWTSQNKFVYLEVNKGECCEEDYFNVFI